MSKNVLDKMLNVLKLNDEFDEDVENEITETEEEPVEESEPKQKKGFFASKINTPESDTEDSAESKSKLLSSSGSKVTPIRQPNGRKTNMEVCVIKPTAVDDMREVTEALITGRTVILNLEGLDIEIAQRIIDFTSGSALAIKGNLQKISNFIFLVTPTNVDISGDLQDLQDLYTKSFNVPSIKTKF